MEWNLPLLERGSLLEELERLLGHAASGRGSLALVAGEAGSGKTSVVRAFVEGVTDRALVLNGGCDPLTTPRPLSPLLDIAAHPDSHLGSLVAEGAAPLELFSALLNRVKGTIRPTVLVIEDAHWADEGTLDLLRFIGRRISDTNALAICTYRDDEIGQTHPLRIVIGDLAPRDSTNRLAVDLLSLEAVRTLAGGTGVDPEKLHEATDGNAFYVTEVLASGHSVPLSVQDAVLARVGRLGGRARKVVEAVSTAPRRLEISYLMSLTGAETDDVDETTSAGVLVADGASLRFRHELARAAVEDALPLARRLQLHRQMIALLAEEESADLARLAHHAARAEAGELVAGYAPKAAREASRRGAHREAAELFELALEHLDHLDSDQVAEIRLGLGLEYNMLDRQTESLAQRELAVAHFRSGNDEAALGKALSSLASQRWSVSDNQGGRAAIDEAIEILEPLGPGFDLARALHISSYLWMLARQHQEAIDTGRRAMEMSRQIGSEYLVTANILNLGTIEIVTGDPDEGVRLLKEARRRGEGADEHGLVDLALEMLGSGGGETRYYTEAIPALEEGIDQGLRHDFDYIVAYNRPGWHGLPSSRADGTTR